MPFFVYAIHQDETANRLYDVTAYPDRMSAETRRQYLAAGKAASDNYVVRIIEAATADDAETLADGMRPFPKTTR